VLASQEGLCFIELIYFLMKQGKVSLHAMKACGTAEVYLHAFLASALDGGVNFTPQPLYPRKRNQVPTE
jgi:hypothetical protein